MSEQKQESATAGRSEYHWRVISKPGAAIEVRELIMTDAIRRSLTAHGVDFLPPPNIERFRRFWQLPAER